MDDKTKGCVVILVVFIFCLSLPFGLAVQVDEPANCVVGEITTSGTCVSTCNNGVSQVAYCCQGNQILRPSLPGPPSYGYSCFDQYTPNNDKKIFPSVFLILITLIILIIAILLIAWLLINKEKKK